MYHHREPFSENQRIERSASEEIELSRNAVNCDFIKKKQPVKDSVSVISEWGPSEPNVGLNEDVLERSKCPPKEASKKVTGKPKMPEGLYMKLPNKGLNRVNVIGNKRNFSEPSEKAKSISEERGKKIRSMNPVESP